VAQALVYVAAGAVAGALYAGLVSILHVGAYGRWDKVPGFAVGSVLVGAGLGLLIRWIVRTLPAEAIQDSADSRPLPGSNRQPRPARCTADEEQVEVFGSQLDWQQLGPSSGDRAVDNRTTPLASHPSDASGTVGPRGRRRPGPRPGRRSA
jgi:hypothetical protein